MIERPTENQGYAGVCSYARRFLNGFGGAEREAGGDGGELAAAGDFGCTKPVYKQLSDSGYESGSACQEDMVDFVGGDAGCGQ